MFAAVHGLGTREIGLLMFPGAISGVLSYIGFTLIQTGLINSVSQTLAMQQTGVGMGLFNLVTFISAAIGTALVARVLASGWLDLKLNPLILGNKAFAYSNLMVIFAVLIALGGAVYFVRYRRWEAVVRPKRRMKQMG